MIRSVFKGERQKLLVARSLPVPNEAAVVQHGGVMVVTQTRVGLDSPRVRRANRGFSDPLGQSGGVAFHLSVEGAGFDVNVESKRARSMFVYRRIQLHPRRPTLKVLH